MTVPTHIQKSRCIASQPEMDHPKDKQYDCDLHHLMYTRGNFQPGIEEEQCDEQWKGQV
jgi:hypothetical protein